MKMRCNILIIIYHLVNTKHLSSFKIQNNFNFKLIKKCIFYNNYKTIYLINQIEYRH